LLNLETPGQKDKFEVFITVFDDRVEVFKHFADLPGGLGFFDAVQYRLVVFVHQNHHALAALFGCMHDQVFEAAAMVRKPRCASKAVFQRSELLMQTLPQVSHRTEHAATKAETQHRVGFAPVPASFGSQSGKQGLLAFKQLLESVEKQAFAKTAWAAQKVILALSHQPQRHRGLVNVIVVFFAYFAKRLDANRQMPSLQRSNAVCSL